MSLNSITGATRLAPPLAARPARRALCQYATSAPIFAGTSSQPAHIPVIRSLAQLRRWRRMVRDQGLEVGVMGALHQGHLDLVKTSLSRHPFTVMTLFVNPMQFAPHEDLAAYPRTLERDLDLLRTLLPVQPSSSGSSVRGLGISENDSTRPSSAAPASSLSHNNSVRGLGVSENERMPSIPVQAGSMSGGLGNLVVFAPPQDAMYPLRGDLQDLGKKRGVEVDVKGWGDVMEGASRPDVVAQFFKGVATVCTKLFNAVEPDHAYFGQKDIQQALLLKIMLTDLLLAHPLPEHLHILPTTRDPQDHLALSSRNAYLSQAERTVAPILHRALSRARELYASALQAGEDSAGGEEMISAATQVVLDEQQRLLDSGSEVELRLDYFEVFDSNTFEPVRGEIRKGADLVVAGAVWVGRTRLIDNLLLGWGVADS